MKVKTLHLGNVCGISAGFKTSVLEHHLGARGCPLQVFVGDKKVFLHTNKHHGFFILHANFKHFACTVTFGLWDNIHFSPVISHNILTEITGSLVSNRINEAIWQSVLINQMSLRMSFLGEKKAKTTISRANRLYLWEPHCSSTLSAANHSNPN